MSVVENELEMNVLKRKYVRYMLGTGKYLKFDVNFICTANNFPAWSGILDISHLGMFCNFMHVTNVIGRCYVYDSIKFRTVWIECPFFYALPKFFLSLN